MSERQDGIDERSEKMIVLKLVLNIFKWVLIILFFPLSLVVVGYYKQKKAKKTYWD